MIPLDEKVIICLMKEKLDKRSIKYKDEVLGNFVSSRIAHATSNKFATSKSEISEQTIRNWVNAFINLDH